MNITCVIEFRSSPLSGFYPIISCPPTSVMYDAYIHTTYSYIHSNLNNTTVVIVTFLINISYSHLRRSYGHIGKGSI